jgi:hypothetical protein
LSFETGSSEPQHFDADLDPACHFDADPDPNSTFNFVADPDLDPSFQIKGQNLEKGLKWAHIPYILACHLQNLCVSGSGPSLSL